MPSYLFFAFLCFVVFIITYFSHFVKHRIKLFSKTFHTHCVIPIPDHTQTRVLFLPCSLQITLQLTFLLTICIQNNISLLLLSFHIITIIGKDTSNKHSFRPLYPGGGLKLIINFICKLLGIAIHFTNSLDFFTFSNFPFAYFLAYFLYISIHPLPHFLPIVIPLHTHSISSPTISSIPSILLPHFLFIQNLVTFFLFSSFSYFSISSQFTLYHPLCEHIFFTFFSYFY